MSEHRSFLKYQYVRSKRLIEAYRLLPCQFDNCLSGQRYAAIACHSNWGWGRGKSVKSDDSRAASGCPTCHYELDQGKSLTEDERKLWWWPAHVRSVEKLVLLGAWPKNVPLPDISAYPW